MGIGKLYKEVLKELGHEVVTVDKDISKGADMPTIDSAIIAHAPFDTVVICTPNFTHESIAYQVAPHAKIVFVEKPGVMDSTTWKNLVLANPRTRFMMIKNNQWRLNIDEMKALAKKSNYVRISWVNYDRIPSPGSWFTNKDLAYGGVSRDLMPHLLSLFAELEPGYENATLINKTFKQNWSLEDVSTSDYGVVDPNGIYNVDDECTLEFQLGGCQWVLTANWRSMSNTDVNIHFRDIDNILADVELGLCPGEAYSNMIKNAIKNINNADFWKKQFKHDTWIHDRIAQ